jgi:hypothetical protein
MELADMRSTLEQFGQIVDAGFQFPSKGTNLTNRQM